MAKCANCGQRVFFAKQDAEGRHFCNKICSEHFSNPDFCASCIAETGDDSPGGTLTVNSIGTKLYGSGSKCQTCGSIVQRKFFCVLFIPLLPLKKYRIKKVTSSRYRGRVLLA